MPYDTAYMWNLKENDTNEFIYKTEIQLQILLFMVTRVKREGRINWEIGNHIYILLYIRQISKKWITSPTV